MHTKIHLLPSTGLLLAFLLMAALVFTARTALADGGGYPTATPPPTSTPTLTATPVTQPAGKALSSTPILPAPTFTSAPLSQPAGVSPIIANPVSPTSTPKAGAPQPAKATAAQTTGSSAGLSLPVIVGLASVGTIFVVILLLIARRR